VRRQAGFTVNLENTGISFSNNWRVLSSLDVVQKWMVSAGKPSSS
jgi:hypothetical protein